MVHVVTCDVEVTQSATLTIQGGAIVKFHPHTQLNINGQLFAVGTSASPIYFTSVRDNSVGDDTTGNDTGLPARGDWGNIQFRDGSNGIITRAIIRYSGLDTESALVTTGPIVVMNASPELSYITFEHNAYNAVEINNAEWNNAEWNSSESRSNSGRWNNDTVVYVINQSDLTIPANQNLTLSPGMKIKLGAKRHFHVHGRLNADGTQEQPITFTSLLDDSICGIGAKGEAICDSNNDGESSTPLAGDWGQIHFYPESNDLSSISRVKIHYAGQASEQTEQQLDEQTTTGGPIVLDNASPLLSHITFAQNVQNGVVVQTSDTWQSDIWDNNTIVYIVNQQSLTISQKNKLTILPKIQIKLGENANLNVLGTLNAVGMPGIPITFTSLADDTVCGVGAADEPICDTNGDGSSMNPSVGDWGQIRFRAGSSESHMVRTVMRFSGSDSGADIDDAPIELENSLPTLAYITFEQNYLNAVELSAMTDWGHSSWRNNKWQNNTIVHVVEDADIIIPVTQTVTISSGFKLKLAANRSIQVEGRLNAEGTAEEPIHFTSLYDDSVCGIGANNESICVSHSTENERHPTVGDWGHIRFVPTSHEQSNIRYAHIRYSGRVDHEENQNEDHRESPGGNQSDNQRDMESNRNEIDLAGRDGAIYLDNAAPTLSNISFADNYINGVELGGGREWETTHWANPTVLYVLEEGDITIPLSHTLTISPGMAIKLGNQANLKIAGELVAAGTITMPITFTSLYDNTLCGIGIDGQAVGCQTHLASNDLDPQPGDWGKIEFMASSSQASTISRAVLRYSGTGSDDQDNAAILLNNISPLLSSISFEQNEINGVSVTASRLITDNLSLTNSRLRNLGLDTLDVGAETYWLTNQWANESIVYVIDGSNITVPAGQELTVAQGVKVKLGTHKTLTIDGKLSVAGTLENPVYFTSFNDDTVCGIGARDEPVCDTNGDGESSAPQIGDWGQIRFTHNSLPTSSVERAIIRYSGRADGVALDDSAILLDGASPTLLYSSLSQNYRGIEIGSESIPSLICNDIYANQEYGLYNGNPAEGVYARQHWWGSESGPAHHSNASGTGDPISDGIDFAPWATKACMTEPKEQDAASDLELSVNYQRRPAEIGVRMIVTATVINLGVGPADEVAVRFLLPEQEILSSGSHAEGSCDIADRTVICTIGDLAVGHTSQAWLTATIIPKINNELTFSVNVSHRNENDPNLENNWDTLVIGQSIEKDLYLPLIQR
ncbi:MAG: hypothetical protein AAF702_17275 [Chloroflexota bacterium]